MTQPIACLRCGSTQLADGFIDDTVQGRVRWLAGPIEVSMFGNTHRMGRDRSLIRALRCTACGHLELFATDEA